jgi:hypothetical protein
MPANRSESFLLQLAERTFLKPWAIPGPAHKAGKEISDLVIPFGDDVIVISDKACDFDIAAGLRFCPIGAPKWRPQPDLLKFA